MTVRRVALVAAICALVAWAAKAVAIGVAGGLGESPAEGPLFFLGAVLMAVGTVALGLSLGAGRPLAIRVAVVLAVVVGVAVVSLVVAILVSALQPADAGWAWGEVNLWAGALALLAATVTSQRRLTPAAA